MNKIFYVIIIILDLLFSQCQSYKKLLGEQANQDKINFFDSINKTYGEPAVELKTEKGIIDNSSISNKLVQVIKCYLWI